MSVSPRRSLALALLHGSERDLILAQTYTAVLFSIGATVSNSVALKLRVYLRTAINNKMA